MALPADHKNFGSIGSIGERAGYAGDIDVKPIVIKKLSSSINLLFGFELLVRGFYHLVLLRQVDPKLQAARFGLSRFVDRHFGVDDWKE